MLAGSVQKSSILFPSVAMKTKASPIAPPTPADIQIYIAAELEGSI